MKARLHGDQGAREQPSECSQRGVPQGAADQPRPALGRRPWLALERRARSLRRFFFAITGGRVPLQGRQPSSALLCDVVSGWASPPVVRAETANDRLVGLRNADGAITVVMRARSVHGIGLRTSLGVVGIGPQGRVRRRRHLKPRGVLWFADCRWIIELPAGYPLPPLDARLVWRRVGGVGCAPAVPMLASWQGSS